MHCRRAAEAVTVTVIASLRLRLSLSAHVRRLTILRIKPHPKAEHVPAIVPARKTVRRSEILNKQRLQPSVVLVADRTLSADYKILFEGIFGTMQTTQVAEFAMRHLVSPRMSTDKMGRARAAVLGLRRIESLLIAETNLCEDDIVCTTPEALGALLGPWVKIVMVSSSDPLGMGMSNTTTTNFWKGQLYTRHWTAQMMGQIARAKSKYGFTVVAGGAGAWQWARRPDVTAEQGIDVVFEGYFENIGAEFVTELLNGNEVAEHYVEPDNAVENVKSIRRASLLGIVELSRGCGKGCNYCTSSSKRMGHLPVDTILSDLEANVAAGITSVVSGSEDFFRYGAKGSKPNFDKLHGLLNEMRKIEQLSFMQIDHGNIASVMQLSNDQLKELRRLLSWRERSDYLWVNMGIESANGHLVEANSAGKRTPFAPEDWEDIVREAADKMISTGFFPVFSIILGLPGETPQDVERTLRLIKALTQKRAVIFPIFYEPLGDNESRFTIQEMRSDHLELYVTCYEQNFKLVPRLFWDNQRAGGVSWSKRALMHLLGKTEVRAWRKTFKRLGKQLAGRQEATSVGTITSAATLQPQQNDCEPVETK